jgi:hypothetical protein
VRFTSLHLLSTSPDSRCATRSRRARSRSLASGQDQFPEKVGCIGTRVYTAADDAEAYFAIPGAQLSAVEEHPSVIVRANQELEKFHRARAEHEATAARAPGLPTPRVRTLRLLWSRPQRQLVEGASRVLRLLPLPPWLSCGERHEGEVGGALRRRTGPASVLQIWKARKAAVSEEIAIAERSAKAIQDKLDRLDEAFLFERSIDIETYDRRRREIARGAHARSDRPSLRPAR